MKQVNLDASPETFLLMTSQQTHTQKEEHRVCTRQEVKHALDMADLTLETFQIVFGATVIGEM